MCGFYLVKGGIILSAKLLRSMINQVREVIDDEFGVADETGLIIACSDSSCIGKTIPGIDSVLACKDQNLALDGYSYHKIFDRNKLDSIVYIKSEEDCLKYLSLIAINVINLKAYYDEKFEKINFIRSILFDNALPGDLSLRIKELHIPYNGYRVVLVVKTDKTDDSYVHDVIQELFPNKTKDFIIILDNNTTVLLKELKSENDYAEIEKTAAEIINTLNSELMIKANIGIGSIVHNIADIRRSFDEAKTALQVGAIFSNDRSVFNYNNLGIGRLIYQLPDELCRLFLHEVFSQGAFESLDAETIHTIQKFFENNLNVSETSRQLYVHRNTLVYRLDKIQKITGLDIRKFDDAIIFKVAMLVKKYVDKQISED